MNFLLLAPEELSTDGTARLCDRRAEHLRTVLRAEPGQLLRCGILNGMLGEAEVLTLTAHEATVRVTLQRDPEPVGGDVLLLATPRPKVLMRMLAHAAALGFARIVLFRSWRVDKTWMMSKAFDPAVQREQLLYGLEQAGRTRIPDLEVHDRFKPMIEDHLDRMELPSSQRFVAHPTARTATHTLTRNDGPFALALGPDGGFLPYEVEQFESFGFTAITCGPHALRTETALAVLWGQLHLLRQRQ
ncbi:MAG: 16S rRNA (uracil(1498)-N(3))-methyltransferase [Planctomycetota bacterium]